MQDKCLTMWVEKCRNVVVINTAIGDEIKLVVSQRSVRECRQLMKNRQEVTYIYLTLMLVCAIHQRPLVVDWGLQGYLDNSLE